MKERNLGNAGQGENFSSQNVRIFILKIIRRGARSGKTEVFLSNGSSFFVTQGIVIKSQLEPGMVLEEIQIQNLKNKTDFILAKKKSLEFLSVREHTVYQLKRKLLLKNFPPEIIENVLYELQEEGSLSNERFAEVWIRSRIKKHPEGLRLLLSGLLKAGIPSSEAGTLLNLNIGNIDFEEVLKAAAGKIMRKNNITKDKLFRSLKGRGFDMVSIIKFVENHYDKYDK